VYTLDAAIIDTESEYIQKPGVLNKKERIKSIKLFC